MAKTPLFNNWPWKLSMPEPFDKIASNMSTTHYSTYCTVATKKATLHGSCRPCRCRSREQGRRNGHFRERIRATIYEHKDQYTACGDGVYRLNYQVA